MAATTIIGIIILVLVLRVLVWLIGLETTDGHKNWFAYTAIAFIILSWAWIGAELTVESMKMKQGEINQMRGTPKWEMKILYEINENGETIPADTLYIKIKKQ